MAVNTDDCVDCVSDADPVKGTEVNADSQVADQTRTIEITVAYKGIVQHPVHATESYQPLRTNLLDLIVHHCLSQVTPYAKA
jgi:hypothetical protein